MAPGRKKGSTIPMEQRLEALKRMDRGDSLKDVAVELGLASETVRRWKLDRKRIEEFCMKAKKKLTATKTRSNEYLDEAVFAWYTLRRKRGVPVTGPMIENKALDFYELMEGSEKFHGFGGWLNTWVEKYGIRLSEAAGEKLTDATAVHAFTRRFWTVIENEGLTRDQIFSCEETELLYKTLPSKTNFLRLEREAPGLKRNRDRVTILACSNASGSLKLPLMVIGKIAKPRSLEHLDMDNLPVFYAHNKRVRMDHELFKEWFNIEFIPRVTRFLRGKGLPLKALLIIDDSPSHPPEKDLTLGAIKTMFFPKNMTCHMQPMNQGVMENFKRRFLYKILLETQDDSGEIVQRLKNISMKDLIFWVAEAWEGIASSTIEQSWQACSMKGLKKAVPKNVDISNAQFLQVFQGIRDCQSVDEKNIKQWIGKNIEAMDSLSDQEILYMVMNDQEDEENNEQRDERSTNDEMVTPTEAGFSKQFDDSYDMALADTQQFSSDDEMGASPAATYSGHIEGIDAVRKDKQQGSHNMERRGILRRIKKEYEEGDPLSDRAIQSMAMEGGKRKSTAVEDFEKTDGYHVADKRDTLQWIKKEYEDLVTDTVTPTEVMDFHRIEAEDYEEPVSVRTMMTTRRRVEEKESGHSLDVEVMDLHDTGGCQAVHKDQLALSAQTTIPTIPEHRRVEEKEAGHSLDVEMATSTEEMNFQRIGGCRREEEEETGNSLDVDMVTSSAAMDFCRNKNPEDTNKDENTPSDPTMCTTIMEGRRKEENRNSRLADRAMATPGEVMGFRKEGVCPDIGDNEYSLPNHTIPIPTQIEEHEKRLLLESEMVTSSEVTDLRRNENYQNVGIHQNSISSQAMISAVMDSKKEEEKRDCLSVGKMVTSTDVIDFRRNEAGQNISGDQNLVSDRAMIPVVMGSSREEENKDCHLDSGLVTSAGVMDLHRNEGCQNVGGNENPLPNQAYILIVHESRRDEEKGDCLSDNRMVTSAGNENSQGVGVDRNTLSNQATIPMVTKSRRENEKNDFENISAGQSSSPDQTMAPVVMGGRREEENRDRLLDNATVTSAGVMDFRNNEGCQNVVGNENPLSNQAFFLIVHGNRSDEEKRDNLLDSRMATSREVMDFRRNEVCPVLGADKNPTSDQAMIPKDMESRTEEEMRDNLSGSGMVRSAEAMNARRNEDLDEAIIPMAIEGRREKEKRESEIITSTEQINFQKIECYQDEGSEILQRSIKKEYEDTDPFSDQEMSGIDPLDSGMVSSVGTSHSHRLQFFQDVDKAEPELGIKSEYEADPLFIEMQDSQIDEGDSENDRCPEEIKKLTAAEAVEGLSYIIKICEEMEDITIEELQLLYKCKDLILLHNWRKKREEKERMTLNEDPETAKL